MFHEVEQNTDEWLGLRVGKLTSSSLATVMANYGKAFGDPAKKLAVSIAIGQITGQIQSGGYSNAHMERGHIEEPIARELYERDTFCEVLNGGFYDAGFVGCSPDGRVGENGLIEIKSAIEGVHHDRVKRGKIDPTYKWQCISNMKIAEKEWIDFISYCSSYPENKKLFVYRAYAEEYAEEYAMIDSRVAQFKEEVIRVKAEIESAEYWNINRKE